jgi:ABC-type phosphate transport system substrate-binding protein
MPAPRAIASIVALALAALSASVTAGEAPSSGYQVIVHPRNPAASVDRTFLADAFFENITRWPDGSLIRPVDLRPQETARSAFSRDVLKRSVEAVKAYWQQRIFAGRGVPPPELAREADVLSYVLRHEGAVGYVSGGFDIAGAKAVAVSR